MCHDSTHIIWRHGAEIMNCWGLLDRLAATGCPQFYSAITGSLPLPVFMNPENIGRIMAAAGGRA